jgi:hypothetical protein
MFMLTVKSHLAAQQAGTDSDLNLFHIAESPISLIITPRRGLAKL